MSAETVAKANFRGVKCHHCGKPVRVPSSVTRQESASHSRQEEDGSTFHLISRVFVLRCRSCEKESVYAINQIADFDGDTVPVRHKAAVA